MIEVGQYEDRTRVTCNLPVKNAAQEKAFKDIILYLQSQHKEYIGITGYTFSTPNSFRGYWWNEEQGCWEKDNIVLLIVDYNISLADPVHSLAEKISELKTVIQDRHKEYGSEQQEVWIVAQPVMRYE